MRFAVLLLSTLACSATDLEHRIDALVDATAPPGRGAAGISVVDLATGKTIYRHNDEHLFLPASNMKLFTTALALLRLEADHRFVTQVFREHTGNDSTGDLILAGSGDPSLSGRVFPYQKDSVPGPPLKAIDDLADQIAATGIRRIDGDIVGDDRLYPWSPYAPSWTQDDAQRDFGAPVSALTLNDNTIAVSIRPAAHAGDPAELSFDPPLEYYAVDNRIETTARGAQARIRMSRQPGSRQLLLWGSIPAGHASIRESLPVDDPALYAASALYAALTRRGIAIAGRPVARHRSVTEDYEAPAGPVIASRTSPPLVHLLQVMDKVSQNLFAELMLREVGRITRHQATREAGLEELAAMLYEIGASKDESVLEDGSGLSRNALVTPRLVTRLLTFVYGSKYRDDWMSLLPVGGEDGTLQHRLCCMTEGSGIRAKTGSLGRAVALSGYADSKTRGRLAFSILVDDFSAPPAAVRLWIDKIAAVLLE